APSAMSPGTPRAMSGKFHVVHADDFDPKRSRFFYMLEDRQTGKMHHLEFQQPPTAQEHKRLQTGAMVTVRGTAQGDTIALATAGTAQMTVQAPPPAAAVAGPQKTLVLVANFRDAQVACTNQTIRDIMFTDAQNRSIDDLYRETSYGQVSLEGQVLGPYTIDYASTSPCNYYAWSMAAEAAARARGVDLSQYSRRVYVLPEDNSCGYIGLGTIGGKPSMSWIFNCDMPDVYGHELGHNLSAHHASTPSNEYGDTSDIMGYGGIGLRHFNAPHKDAFGWLDAEQSVTVKQSGIYSIAPLELQPEDITAPQVLKIAKPDTSEFYYFSYRRPLGFDSKLSPAYLDRVNVHRYGGSGSSQTYFLQALVDGGTFTDATNGITVTQLRHDAQTATVQIAFTCTRTAPLVTLTPSTQTGGRGTQLRYVVSVTNKDGASCAQSTLNLGASVPAGWTGSVSPTSLALLPGARGSAVLSVTPPTTAVGGNYSIRTQVSDSRVAAHTVAATATYVLDLTPPQAPATLTGKIVRTQNVLSWSAATDNVRVSYYTIWRNGARRAIEVGTSFSDSFLKTGTKYTYYVVATDQAGNNSTPSPIATIQR
ncbi:MAG: hypothetical protein FJZ47_19090, partial [Candidatus Tectomicrobia bacterium]|nr:hypothetical protein [Candidatus Tectomicrobia bacterium]